MHHDAEVDGLKSIGYGLIYTCNSLGIIFIQLTISQHYMHGCVRKELLE